MLESDFLYIEQEKIEEMERNDMFQERILSMQATVEKLNVG